MEARRDADRVFFTPWSAVASADGSYAGIGAISTLQGLVRKQAWATAPLPQAPTRARPAVLPPSLAHA
eukprot:2854901-Prymnesium_polylepis.1